MDTSKPTWEDISTRLEYKLRTNRTYNKVTHDLETMQKKRKPSSARMDYVLQQMTQHKVFPDMTKMEEEKSDAKSVEFRNLGNTYFSSKPPKFVQALSTYNKSICYAVSPENISTAIANRSAVFFNMQMYPECLESIRLARELGIPERIGEKLTIREGKCHEKLENMPPKENLVAEIGMPVNEEIPFMAKCLKLKENKKFGKHIVTEEHIPAGTFIAIQEPLCKIVANSDKYLRCATCLLEVPHLLLPCGKCTQTMFCSNDCKEKAWKDFHTIECPISGALFRIFDHASLLAIRLCIRGLLVFPDTESMALGLQRIYKEKKTEFNFNWKEKLTPEDHLTLICSLPSVEDKIQPIALPTYVVICLIYKMLKSSTILCQRYMTTNAAEDIVKDFAYRNLLSTDVNSIAYGGSLNLQTSDFPREYGCAMKSSNLFTRSCNPNTCTIGMGSVFGLFTTKNIAAGEKLEHVPGGNGKQHFTLTSKRDRQRYLVEQFGFHCECSACINDYPEVEGLPYPECVPEFRPIGLVYPSEDRRCLCRFLVATNRRNMEMSRAYIQKYEHPYPNAYICMAQTTLHQSFAFLYGGVSLRLRNEFPNRCPNCNDRLF